MENTTGKRLRARNKLLRVTFPDGNVFCYKNVTFTMIETLKAIGPERFGEIKLELCHLPLLAREIYPRYREWMKPVCEGWYLNTQSDTSTKFLQLNSINASLGLGLNIEIGEDFEPMEKPQAEKRTKSKQRLSVGFPDGTIVEGINSTDIFIETICRMGIDEIARRDVQWGGRPLLTTSQSNNRQLQLNEKHWLNLPNTTKDKAKLLRVIALMMHTKLEINLL